MVSVRGEIESLYSSIDEEYILSVGPSDAQELTSSDLWNTRRKIADGSSGPDFGGNLLYIKRKTRG